MTTRPVIELIWAASVHRGHNVGAALVGALADDSSCKIDDVSWSNPVSTVGHGWHAD